MGLLRRERGPYAPQPKGKPPDFLAMERERMATRAAMVREHEAAVAGMAELREDENPLAQLTKRAYAHDQRMDALAEAVERMGKQLQTIVNHLEASRDD